MTTKIKFTKMHGAGNDYIYVDRRQSNGASFIQESEVMDLY